MEISRAFAYQLLFVGSSLLYLNASFDSCWSGFMVEFDSTFVFLIDRFAMWRVIFLVYFKTVVARLAPGTYMFKTPVHSDARLHPSLFALIHRPSSTSVAKVLDRTRLSRIAGSFHMRSHSWPGLWKRPGSGAVPISTTPELAIVARDGHAHCLYKTRGATSQGAWTRSSIRLERPGTTAFELRPGGA